MPTSELAGATIGDVVTVEGDPHGDEEERRATIAALDERADVSYFRLDFESPG